MSYKESKEGEYTVRTSKNGTKMWYLNGKQHREDGPAVEYADGENQWLSNGLLHREDGPAYTNADGTKVWYVNSERHREDGPAIEYADGHKEWYLNNKLVYNDNVNKLKNYPYLTEEFKKSIILYELRRT